VLRVTTAPKTATVNTAARTVTTMETIYQPLSSTGATQKKMIVHNEEDLAISDDELDLHGDAAASFSFASLVTP
jgi:hypothetical protein